jgi:acetoin utilization protein AcuB
MLIDAIMIRSVVTVGLDDTLRTVQALFERYRFHHAIVVDQGRVVGVVSDRDLFRNLSPFIGMGSERPMDQASLNRKVHQIMSRRPITVGGGEPIASAGLLMLQHNISCLPVVDAQGGCRGVVTSRDVLRWCLQCGCSVVRPAA